MTSLTSALGMEIPSNFHNFLIINRCSILSYNIYSFDPLSLIVLFITLNFMAPLPALKKQLQRFLRFIATLRHQFVFCFAAPFICVLVVSYIYMEIGPVYILMDYLSYSWGRENLRKAAILTNLQDILSSYFEVVVSQMSQAFTGCFTMITFCAAASTTGLMFLWISSTSSSEFHTVYIAIFLLALGKGGQHLLSDFLEERLDEKVRVGKERKPEHENTDHDNNDNKKERHQIVIIVNIWWYSAKYAGILLAFCISYYFFNISDSNYFKLAALLMGGTALFFYFGCARYNPKSCENLPTKSDLCKIIRSYCIALKKRKFRYPTLASSYYWKPYKQNHRYLYDHGEELRLIPEVPRIFGWVDKAAIIKEQYSADSDPSCTPQRQEKKGEPCTVKEVSEVKSLVPLMQLGFTFFAYCLISASANTFFVEQVSNLRPAIIKDGSGNDISLLYIAMSIMSDLSRFIYWLLGFAFGMLRKSQVTRFKRLASAAIRIVIGMVCAQICCIIAWRVEVHRLSLIKKLKNPNDENISMTTMDLLPQFLLLGVTEGFLETGLSNLFYGLASKSMWGFENSFNQMVIGTGKLFTIPFIMIFSGWIKDEVNTSHLDKYYLMLAILNFVFLLAFVYVSFSIRYAYKEECPNDEDIEMDQQRMEHAREEDLEEEENETEKECSNDEETDMEHRLENIAHGEDPEEENETEEECSNDEEINGMEQSLLKHAYEEENVTEENLEFGKDLYSMVGRGSIRERKRNTACDDSK